MACLRYLIFLFASSMVVKIPLMALFHWLYLLITGNPWIESAHDAFSKIVRSEALFFIPLYLIYLPLFIYNIKTQRIEPRFMYWDMSMICFVICPLAFGIALNHSFWFACSTTVFIAAYLMFSATLHLRFSWPHISGDGLPLPYLMDKTSFEYTQWQEQIEKAKKDRQEKSAAKSAEKLQATANKKTHRSIERVFFYTGLFATMLSTAAIISFCYLISAAYLCYILNIISTMCFETWAWSMLKPSFVDILLYFSLIVYVPIGMYAAIIFVLYGPIIKRLWHDNMRTYAHFGLAANIPILAYVFALQGVADKSFSPDLKVISFYIFSYTTLLASAIHLNLLKRYDKAFAIPQEPHRPKRWYDKFFGRQIAEV